MQASRTHLLTAAALALVLAAPAAALEDMTGGYTGKMSCKGYAGGAPDRAKQDLAVSVVESKGNPRLRFAAGGVPLADTVLAYVLEDATKLDRAKLQGLDCGSTVASAQSLTVEADVVIKPAGGKGTIKGSLIRRDATAMPGVIAVCSFTVKRTSTELPEVPACPLVEM
jgi:hypothetical protein